MSKIKLSVCGVIVYQSKFLIVKRSETDDFLPNCWEFPGGSVEDGETIQDALKRELKEEIGLDISSKPSQLIGISEEFMNKDKVLELIDKYKPVIVSCKDGIIGDYSYKKGELDIIKIFDYYKDKESFVHYLVNPSYLKLPQAMEEKK